jgi:PiT family inorganic phosphate transporter
MCHKIATLNHGQGFSANLATGIFVTVVSLFGLPISTTHASIRSFFGIGLATKQPNPRVIRDIVLFWIISLPCAALLSTATYALPRHL